MSEYTHYYLTNTYEEHEYYINMITRNITRIKAPDSVEFFCGGDHWEISKHAYYIVANNPKLFKKLNYDGNLDRILKSCQNWK